MTVGHLPLRLVINGVVIRAKNEFEMLSLHFVKFWIDSERYDTDSISNQDSSFIEDEASALELI